MVQTFTYDLAISFAGEDRKIAAFIADQLKDKFSLFYDEFEKAQLWGADLSEALPKRYEQSRYCIIVYSPAYLEKAWTTLERQTIVMEFLRRRGRDYVLMLLVGDTKMNLPGVSGLTGFVRVRSDDDLPGVVDLLIKKLHVAS